VSGRVTRVGQRAAGEAPAPQDSRQKAARTEATVSEFDNLKDKGEQYVQQHPEQVKKGEEAVEDKLGIGQQDQAGPGQQGQGNQGQGNQGQGNQGQGDPQDQQGGDQQPG
jgi:hypothetical protein